MKSAIAIIFAAIVASAPAAFASDEVLIEGQRITPGVDAGVKALDACVESFVNTILPNRAGLRIRVNNQGSAFDQEFNSHSIAGQSALLDITLEARLKTTGALLATSVCTVGKSANVVNMKTSMPEAAKLSALKPNEFTLTVKMG